MNNEKKVKTKKTGLFSAGVSFLVNAVYNFIINSRFGKLMTSADKVNSMIATSYILGFVRRVTAHVKDKFRKQPKKMVGTEDFGRTVGIYGENTVGRSLKKQLRYNIESSAVLTAVRGFADRIMALPVMTYGIFILAFGISITAVQTFRMFTSETPADSVIALAQGILMLILAIPALVRREESLFDCLRSSVAGNFIMYRMMGVTREKSLPVESKSHYGIIMFVLGVVAGLFTNSFAVGSVCVTILLFVCAVRILFVPEFGVILLLLVLPFFSLLQDPETACAYSIIYISICFFLNVIVGKRSFNLSFTDFFVALFVLATSVASFGAPYGDDTVKHVLLFVGFTLGYFVVRNLIRSAKWFERSITAFLASSVAVCVFAVVQRLIYGGERITSVFDEEMGLALLSGIAFIVTLTRLIVAKKHSLLLVAFLLVEITALYLSDSKLVLLMLAAAVVGLMLVYSRKTVGVLALGALALPLLSCLLAGFDYNEFASLLTFSSAGQAEKVEVWRTSANIAGDYLFVGIGLGESVFENVYAAYAPSGTAAVGDSMSLFWQMIIQTGIAGVLFFASAGVSVAVSVFTVYSKKEADEKYKFFSMGICAALAFMLATGFFVYVWKAPVLFATFWTLLGLAMSALRLAREKIKSQLDYLENVSGDISLEFVNR